MVLLTLLSMLAAAVHVIILLLTTYTAAKPLFKSFATIYVSSGIISSTWRGQEK